MSRLTSDDVEREAKHHFELHHALRNRIGDGEVWEVDGYSFDRVEPEEPTESGFADLVLYDGTDPVLVIECKKLVKGEAIEEFDPHSSTVIKQASGYADDLGAEYIATYNGETMVLLRAHEVNRGLLHRRKISYSQSDFDSREDLAFTVLEDMVAIDRGDARRWDEEFDVLVDRLKELHQFIYPHLEDSLESRLSEDDDFAGNFAEWANKQGLDYETDWVDDDSLSRKKERQMETVHNKFAREDAYLLINQLIFYKIVEDTDKFETYTSELAYKRADTEDKILAIRNLSVDELDFLREYLSTRFDTIVEDVDYKAVFEQNDVFGSVEYNDRVADTVNDFIDELGDYNLSEITGDFLGELYEELIPTKERKDLGEFYTPQKIARLIVHATMDSPDDIVLDPAVGTGTFPVEAYEWLNDHNGKSHQEVVDQIAGVDVNRFAAHLAVINLARQNLNAKTERTNIHVEDFFDVGPDQHLLSTETADINESESGFDPSVTHKFDDVNVVVGNPPYINRNEIDDKDEKRDHLPTKYANYGNHYISKKSDIYQYFFTKGLEWLDDGGRLGFITSYKWTTIESGEGLMNYFLNNAKIKGIIWFNKALFEDALVNTCVTILEKQGEDDPDNKEERDENVVPFLRLEEKRPVSEILDLLDSDISHEGENYRVIRRKQSELAEEKKWSRFLVAPTEYFELVQHDKITTLPEICATEGYLTGIKTQCDDFFKVDEGTVEEYEIPDKYLTPGLMTKRDIDDGAFLFTADDTDEYFVDLHDLVLDVIDEIESSPIVSDDGEVKATNKVDTIQRLALERLRDEGHDKFADYIEEKGEKHDYPPKNKDGSHDLSHNIYTRGEVWFDLDELETPELVIPETRQHNPGVMWNVDRLAVKDIGRPVYLTAGEEKLMAGVMNSAIGRLFIESHGRISGGQAIRVMVYDMKTLPVVDPREIEEEEAERIRDAFDDWITDPSNEDYNEELDEAVLSVLDWEDRVEEIQDIAERMKNIRNESREYEVLVGETEREIDISDVVSDEAKTETQLSDFT
ncbi:class I SAM-dependent DNA methyltransferase [Halopenitus sp. H-Gu1]|uniref:HsdM family class I SAM-dependent methyltransferase n=1 Tax=Halopenitus sp. H-Gu1 TaxID=3242697 RepID=UPI00359E6C38